MLFEDQWNNLVLFLSLIASRLKFAFNGKIDALAEQARFTDANNMTIAEQAFVIELLKVDNIGKTFNRISFEILFFR